MTGMDGSDVVVVWRCHGCGQALGVVAGRRLRLSLVVLVEGGVRVQCVVCRRWQRWYPSATRKARGGDGGVGATAGGAGGG